MPDPHRIFVINSLSAKVVSLLFGTREFTIAADNGLIDVS